MNGSDRKLTKLESTVLRELADRDSEGSVLARQIDSALVTDRDYTGVGLYTNLRIQGSVPRLKTTNRLIEETPKLSLNHPDLPSGAGVILWLDQGMISTIEFYTYAGDWPSDEHVFTIDTAEQGADDQAPPAVVD